MGRRSATADLPEAETEQQLSPVQQKVISALIAGRTYLEAAAEAGVTDRTIRRWREKDAAFELALRQQVQDAREGAVMAASVATQTAVKTLLCIAANPDHPNVLRAIQMLINMAGPLPDLKAPTSYQEVADEQSFAFLQRYESRGF